MPGDIEEVHPVTSEVSAEVIADTPVTLWKNGLTAIVSSRDVVAMQLEGWLLRSPDDIPGLLVEIDAYAGQVTRNLKQFIEEVQKDGFVDPQDGALYSASLTARRLLDEKVEALLGIVHQAYPMRQGEPVQMVDPADDAAKAIDPNQVEEFEAAGWRKV